MEGKSMSESDQLSDADLETAIRLHDSALVRPALLELRRLRANGATAGFGYRQAQNADQRGPG